MISDFYLSKKWGLELYFCQTTKYVVLYNLQFTHSRAKFLPFYHYLYKLNPWKIVRMKRIIQIHPLLFLKTIYWSKYAAGKINLNFFYELWFGNWLLDYMKKNLRQIWKRILFGWKLVHAYVFQALLFCNPTQKHLGIQHWHIDVKYWA